MKSEFYEFDTFRHRWNNNQRVHISLEFIWRIFLAKSKERKRKKRSKCQVNVKCEEKNRDRGGEKKIKATDSTHTYADIM